MAKKNIKLGIFFIILLAFAMSVSGTVTINDIDFPTKIGSAYEGPGFVNSSIDKSNPILIKSKWYKNGSEAQIDSYLNIQNVRQSETFDFDDDSIGALIALIFKDNYVIAAGNDGSSPGTQNPKIFTKNAELKYNLTELSGIDCRIAVFDELNDALWV